LLFTSSDLVILDAQQVDAEPLAVVQLPHRVPFGIHGCWVDASSERL
jgi:carotenoid cleavage dioxygenase